MIIDYTPQTVNVEVKVMPAIEDVTVGFHWDNGDPSVGLWPGWEEGEASYTASGVLTQVFFQPSSEAVVDWSVTACIMTALGQSVVIEPSVRLRDYPAVLPAVEREWDRLNGYEYVEELGLEWASWGTHASDLEVEIEERSWGPNTNGRLINKLLDEYREAKQEERAAKQWYYYAKAAYDREYT